MKIALIALVGTASAISHRHNLGVRFYPEEASVVQMESDPICTSANAYCSEWKKDAAGYPMNYKVPNFGVDHLINENHASLDWAQK